MPIYEYRCASCGFEDEFLQKVSDPVLTECPKCRKPTFEKQMSAAGFQLKGSGWYATDFKNSGAKPAAKSATAKSDGDKSDSDKSGGEKSGGEKPAADTSTAEPSKTDTAKAAEPKKEAKSESA